MTSQFKNTEIVDTGFLRLPRGTTNERPSSPEAGQIRFNTDLGKPEWYEPEYGAWLTTDRQPPVVASGGDTVQDIDVDGVTYRVHSFTTVGSSTFTVTRGGEVEYLIVAGGGGGGDSFTDGSGGGPGAASGGGGAGGLLTGFTTLSSRSFSVYVGSGGSGGDTDGSPAYQPGEQGENSQFARKIAFGGGGGGAGNEESRQVQAGGSGGGAGYSGKGGPSVAGQGQAGGNSNSGNPYAAAGGGGAGRPGGDTVADNIGGDGGSGVSSLITGSLQFYAGGGGAGGEGYLFSDGNFVSGKGGIGGGGDAPDRDEAPQNGTSNTGGGGAGSIGQSSFPGGNGGSGIVVIRYPILNTLNTSTLDLYPGAAAAYSLRRISSNSGSVIRGRRSLDNQERDFSAFEIENGKAEQFAKAQDRLPASYGDGAAAAYSLRYVRGGYTGPVVRVRRSSDNTEQDFTPTEIEDGSLESFCGSSDGLVTTWYDQSGNSNDATQTTASDQPKIVDAGSLVTEDGKAAIEFNNNGNSLQKTGGITGNNPNISIFSAGHVFDYRSSSPHFHPIVTQGAPGGADFGLFISGGATDYAQIFTSNSQSVRVESPAPAEVLPVNSNFTLTALGQDSEQHIYTNGSEVSYIGDHPNDQSGFDASGSADFIIGQDLNDRTTFVRMFEIIIYPSFVFSNREAIEENINRYYGIYEENTADLFVTTWYDQSGNGNDATQTTASDQPKIVSGGVLVTENGRPALNFDGSASTLEALSFNPKQDLAIFQVFTPDSIQGARLFNNDNTNNDPRGINLGLRSDSEFTLFNGNNAIRGGSYSAGEQMITSYIYDESVTNLEFFKNSSSQINTMSVPNDVTKTSFIGSRNGTGTYYSGTFQEIIFYTSDQSSNRELIETNINNHYGIY